MTLTEIVSIKAQGYDMACEHIAREGIDFARTEFRKITAPVGSDLAFWSGYCNRLAGMTAKQSHGY